MSLSDKELSRAIEALAEAGDVRGPRLPKTGWTWRPRGAGLPPGTAMRVLNEAREDRPLPRP